VSSTRAFGRVVHGQTEKDLEAQTGAHDEIPTIDLPCRHVFVSGQRPTEVVGTVAGSRGREAAGEDFWAGGDGA
jgi:hypothetical protein